MYSIIELGIRVHTRTYIVYSKAREREREIWVLYYITHILYIKEIILF